MKKVFSTAVAALAFVALSFAQEATAPAPKTKMTRAKPNMETPAAAQGKKAQGNAQGGMKALGLTPEQETQFKAVNQAHKAAVQAVQADAALAPDAKKAQVAALVTKYQSDVQGVMNAEQFAKWTAARSARKYDGNRKEGANSKEEGEKIEEGHKGDHKGDHKADHNREGTEGYEGPKNTDTTRVVDPNKKRKKIPQGPKRAGN